MLAAALCAVGTALAAGVYRLGPAHDSVPELLIPNADATTGNCGVERWPVKTGTDPDAGQVDITHSTAGAIGQLGVIQAPAALPSDRRIAPTETNVFTVQTTLTKYKLEADSDYHLVLDDGNGHTMITEIPDPACVGITSPFLADIQVARQVFDDHYTATDYFQTANVPVCLTGVGFFDFMHGQTGVAPNGIEIHPVLGLEFDPASCQATPRRPPRHSSLLIRWHRPRPASRSHSESGARPAPMPWAPGGSTSATAPARQPASCRARRATRPTRRTCTRKAGRSSWRRSPAWMPKTPLPCR